MPPCTSGMQPGPSDRASSSTEGLPRTIRASTLRIPSISCAPATNHMSPEHLVVLVDPTVPRCCPMHPPHTANHCGYPTCSHPKGWAPHRSSLGLTLPSPRTTSVSLKVGTGPDSRMSRTRQCQMPTCLRRTRAAGGRGHSRMARPMELESRSQQQEGKESYGKGRPPHRNATSLTRIGTGAGSSGRPWRSAPTVGR